MFGSSLGQLAGMGTVLELRSCAGECSLTRVGSNQAGGALVGFSVTNIECPRTGQRFPIIEPTELQAAWIDAVRSVLIGAASNDHERLD